MGSTYETDGIESRDTVALTVQVACVVKTLGNLIACKSWLQARLALREAAEMMDRLAKMVEAGSK